MRLSNRCFRANEDYEILDYEEYRCISDSYVYIIQEVDAHRFITLGTSIHARTKFAPVSIYAYNLGTIRKSVIYST